MENSIEHIQNLVDNKKFEEAELQARKLLSEGQESIELKTTLARILAIEAKDDEAIDLLKTIIEEDKENSYPLYLLALILENKEEFDKAISYYKKALELKPNSARIHYQLGKIYNNYKYKGKNEYSALQHLRDAITAENPPTDAYLELASIESLSRSIYILQKGLEKYPSDKDLNYRICERLYSSEEYAKCVQAVEEAENRGAKFDEIQLFKVLSLYFLRQYKEAGDVLKPIAKGDSRIDYYLRAFYGVLLCESQDFDEAEDVIKKAIADDIKNSLDFKGHLILTCCFLRSSRIDNAEESSKKYPLILTLAFVIIYTLTIST